jgi:glucose-1-phosphate thymidylyltransferase
MFHGHDLAERLEQARANAEHGATVFTYCVAAPERYGVLQFDPKGRALTLEKNPKAPRSGWVLTGLYVHDGQLAAIAAPLRNSGYGRFLESLLFHHGKAR